MLRVALICSLLGCGLVLDLDPPDDSRADGGRPDVRRPDVPLDVSREDVPLQDVGSVDVGGADGLVVMPDVPELPDVPEPPDVPVFTCVLSDDCGENRPCHEWVCEAGACVEYVLGDDTSCESDGLFCTQGACRGGVCFDTAETLCPGTRTDCSRPFCNEIVDDCDFRAINEGGMCDTLNGVAFCGEGACLLDECLDGFLDCDSDERCETNADVDPENCGSCGNVCPGGGDCEGGSCL